MTAFDEKFVNETFKKLKKISGNIKNKTKEEIIESFEINFKCFESIKQLQNLQIYHHNQGQMNDGRVDIDPEIRTLATSSYRISDITLFFCPISDFRFTIDYINFKTTCAKWRIRTTKCMD